MPLLDIVIVNWNSGSQLKECLQSIAAADHAGYSLARVTVVDNASADRSADGLDSIPVPLQIVRNADNRGFAAACNQGAQASRADYVLFLNPDTRLYADSLAHAMRFMAGPTAAGVGVCGIQLVDAANSVSRTCARFPTPGDFVVRSFGLDRLAPRLFRGYVMSEWPHDADRCVDHVIGAFYLVRRELFEALRGFDQRFFVYLEDLDFSLRARRLGWKCCFLAGARAFHRGGGTSEAVKAKRLCYSLRSRLAYASKHFGPVAAASVWLAAVLVEPWTRIALAMLRVSPAQAIETLKAYRMLLSGEGAAPRPGG